MRVPQGFHLRRLAVECFWLHDTSQKLRNNVITEGLPEVSQAFGTVFWDGRFVILGGSGNGQRPN